MGKLDFIEKNGLSLILIAMAEVMVGAMRNGVPGIFTPTGRISTDIPMLADGSTKNRRKTPQLFE